MKRSLISLPALLVTSLASAGGGVTFSELCPDSSSGGRLISPAQVVYAALDAGSTAASRGVFDADEDGNETLRERVDAILDVEYCRATGKKLCDEGDTQALHDARLLLADLSYQNITAERVGTPSAQDKAEWPALAGEQFGDIAETLDDRGRFFRLECAQQAAQSSRPIRWSAENLRVTGDIESLSLPRGTPEDLRAVTQAEMAYTDDRVANTEHFQVSAFLGYDFAKTPHRQSIGFVGYERDQTSGPETDEVGASKISVGWLFWGQWESLDELSLAPLYAVDRTTDSQVVAVRAEWEPGFLYGISAMNKQDVFGPVVVRMNVRVRAQAGRVIDAGDSAELRYEEDYLRVGPAVKMELWPSSEGPLLSKFSADISYRHFFRLYGPEDVEWWGAGVNYSIDDADHLTIRWSYERGEDEETLEKSDVWKLVFGVRF